MGGGGCEKAEVGGKWNEVTRGGKREFKRDEVLMDEGEIQEEGRDRRDAHGSIKTENKKGRLKE